MKYLLLSLAFILVFSLTGCDSEKPTRPSGRDIQITWEVIENVDKPSPAYKATLTFLNNSEVAFPASGWALFFNRLPREIKQSPDPILKIDLVDGDFYKISPQPDFEGIPAGESFNLEFEGAFWATKESDAPCGLYFVFEEDGKEAIEPTDISVAPFSSSEQYNRGPGDKYPSPDAAYIFDMNKLVEEANLTKSTPFVPSPKTANEQEGSFQISGTTQILYEGDLKSEANFLAQKLGVYLNSTTPAKEGKPDGDNFIYLSSERKNEEEAYSLNITSKGIDIKASGNAGFFYGIQSLLGMINPENNGKQNVLSLPAMEIEDGPAFSYRGLHLDVSRNFHDKASILKVLDLMASYKLNKFHFHLTDDEGWRLEIKGVPELTAYGSVRAHTVDEKNHLHPAYGSGPKVPNHGTGHYTQEDFVEILKYATERHIEVIPEIDLPGHARAAIKAMEFRYEKLKAEKPLEAEWYRLADPEDASSYASVQNYTDNVICICQESTYNLIKTVVNELDEMYQEAGAPLNIVHSGGDEVPQGAWENSPKCQELLAKEADLNNVADLAGYFLDRFDQILKSKGIKLAGWEEVALLHGEGHSGQTPDPKRIEQGAIPYVWNTVNGWGREDLAYKLANAGFKVVMSSAPNLYFDFSYDKDPRENGYYWGGFVSEKNTFDLVPFNVFLSADFDVMGNPIPQNVADGRILPTKEGIENILGIQGQLWTETVKSPEALDYYLFPKVLALAERAWVGNPAWANIQDQKTREKARLEAWKSFTQHLGDKVLPKLSYAPLPVNYRIPAPGGKFTDGTLEANVLYPGLTIRYTTDGSDPTPQSGEYTEPLNGLSLPIKLRAFSANGDSSLVTILN